MRREYLKKTEEWYVTDGLIAMWDGINNTGNGHVTSPSVWKDLVGDADLQIGAGTPQFGSDHCMFRKAEAWFIGYSSLLIQFGVNTRDGHSTSKGVSAGTIELVCRNNSNQVNTFLMFRSNGISLNSKGIWWRPDSNAYIMSVISYIQEMTKVLMTIVAALSPDPQRRQKYIYGLRFKIKISQRRLL